MGFQSKSFMEFGQSKSRKKAHTQKPFAIGIPFRLESQFFGLGLATQYRAPKLLRLELSIERIYSQPFLDWRLDSLDIQKSMQNTAIKIDSGWYAQFNPRLYYSGKHISITSDQKMKYLSVNLLTNQDFFYYWEYDLIIPTSSWIYESETDVLYQSSKRAFKIGLRHTMVYNLSATPNSQDASLNRLGICIKISKGLKALPKKYLRGDLIRQKEKRDKEKRKGRKKNKNEHHRWELSIVAQWSLTPETRYIDSMASNSNLYPILFTQLTYQ